MFLLYRIQQPTINANAPSEPVDHDLSILNHLVRRIVNRARTQDEYEINSDEVWSIGGGGVNILWYNLWWTIEDFLALLLAADDVETALKNADFLEDEKGQTLLNDLQSLPPEERFPMLLLEDEFLAPWRTHIKCFLIWFSCLNDTRIERLLCKVNNVLIDELDLGTPSPSKVRSIRRLVPNIIKAHILGYCSWSEFTELLFEAYERGIDTLSSVEDAAADIDLRPSDNPNGKIPGLLFDCDLSSLGHLMETHLVVRSAYPFSPQQSSLVAKDEDEDKPVETVDPMDVDEK